MTVKSPSKHISLELLIEIRLNNYIGKKGREYHSHEVDELIFIKQSKNDLKAYNELMKQADSIFDDIA